MDRLLRHTAEEIEKIWTEVGVTSEDFPAMKMSSCLMALELLVLCELLARH
jgi:hypothetical protein